jgi:hypothetical protein
MANSAPTATEVRALLAAAEHYVFGAQPGRLPAQLHEALVRTVDHTDRARLAAALARCWAYAGHAGRAARFADEAVQGAERAAEPEVLADCLDAALAAHWGPDELDVRVTLVTRLDDVSAHVLPTAARLQAHLWGLQVGCEVLDLQAMHRHLRALELLGEESPRALFFAASRRLMLDLLTGRTDRADRLIATAVEASREAGLADAWMVIAALQGYTAVQTGDAATGQDVAERMEAFGLAEGAAVVCAEAAFVWLGSGRPERARVLVRMFHPRALHDLPRDVNWLLTLQCLLEAALGTGERDIVEKAAELLRAYPGRAVINAGAVMFHATTGATLARAAAAQGAPEAALRFRETALATYDRIGARWWHDRLAGWAISGGVDARVAPIDTDSEPVGAGGASAVRLHPAADGLWMIGPATHPVPVRALRGFDYLRHLLRRPDQPVPVLELVTGGTGAVAESGLGEVLDRQALQAYRRRLQDIDRDLAEADDWSDVGRREALGIERDALLDQLAGAIDVHGRPRRAGASQERARVAATKAIHAAIARIGSVDGPLGRHLRATIRTGFQCCYRPDLADPVRWVLD